MNSQILLDTPIGSLPITPAFDFTAIYTNGNIVGVISKLSSCADSRSRKLSPYLTN